MEYKMITASKFICVSIFNGLDLAILHRINFSNNPLIDAIATMSMWILLGVLLAKLSSRGSSKR
jgi:hypothetical protein